MAQAVKPWATKSCSACCSRTGSGVVMPLAVQALDARLADAQRADQRAAPAQTRERLRRPPGGGGLAVGAGGGHDLELLAGPAQEQVRDRADLVLQVSDGGDAPVVEAEAGEVVVVDQAGRRARLQRGSDEAARVVRIAWPGQEGIAGAHLAVVGAQLAGHARAQPLCGGVGMGQVQGIRHQKLSGSAGATLLAMICGVTSRSGGTPIRRSVCCTTWLNTGAATAPP